MTKSLHIMTKEPHIMTKALYIMTINYLRPSWVSLSSFLIYYHLEVISARTISFVYIKVASLFEFCLSDQVWLREREYSMGQVYSFLRYGNTRGNSNQKTLLLGENFTCKICLEVLHDPVQCQNNEHYYCRKCITKHLRNSETCPLCMEQLTLETLRPAHENVSSVVSQLKKPCNSSATIRAKQKVVNGQVFIFGGGFHNDEIGKSVELFNWSTKQWTLIENCLVYERWHSFSFLYGKKIMVCSGLQTNSSIEYLNPSESEYTSTLASVTVPYGVGLLYKDRLLTFTPYGGLQESSLESPNVGRILLEQDGYDNVPEGVHCIGNNIYIVGRNKSSMEKYDVAANKMKTLPSLSYEVTNMATVAYKDNIIILGGRDEDRRKKRNKVINKVVMFSVTNQEYRKLPSLLEGRSNFSAVIMEDVIVVMGGWGNRVSLKTVEYYVIGDRAWQKLPAMNLARANATACVYV